VSGSSEQAMSEALMALEQVTRRLRRDCPWDAAQDERSIVPHTVEESYELAEAAHLGEDDKLLDELGDVLFQVYFLSLLLEERGRGDLGAVARNVTEKLVRRHPHVFGDGGEGEMSGLPTQAATPAEVRENWDVIKQREAPQGHPLASVPRTLPALMYVRKLQRKAAGGSDRIDTAAVLADLRARLDDAEQAIHEEGAGARAQEETRHGSQRLYAQIGDLLFATVELSRSLQVDPELALKLAGERFRAEKEAT
jgi:MazG family protein